LAQTGFTTKLHPGLPPIMYSALKALLFLNLAEQSLGASLRHAAVAVTAEQIAEQIKNKLGKTEQNGLSALSMVLSLKARVQTGSSPLNATTNMIDGLVADLKNQSAADVDLQSYCSSEKDKSTREKKKQELNLEQLDAEEEAKTELSKKLFAAQVTLKKDIAKNDVGLSEATALRKKEKESYGIALADAKEGKEACEYATEKLKEFYGGSFVQEHTLVAGPAVDSSGESVADKAPTFDYKGDYEGDSGNSGVIKAIEELGVAATQEVTDLKSDEAEAVADFNKFKEATESDIKEKTGVAADKTKERAETEERLVEIHDEKLQALEDIKNLDIRIAHLNAKCDLDWAERELTREQQTAQLEELKQSLSDLMG